MPEFRRAAIALLLLLVACGGSSDEQPSPDPGATPPTTTPDGGADPGTDGGPPVSSVDAGTDGSSSPQAGVPNAEFDATLSATVSFETSLPLASPAANAKWIVLATIRDRTRSKVYPDVTVLAGPVGAKVNIPFLAPNGNRLTDAFPGVQTGFEVDMDRGAASLHGARVDCPAFHTYTWTVTPTIDGQEKHVVTWSPSGEPDVVVAISGPIDPQLMLPNTGTREWTQAPGAAGRQVQVYRTKLEAFGTSATLQCTVRVTTTL